MIEADVPRTWNSLHEAKLQVDQLKERKQREENTREEQESSSN
jgi:hypothetical protein